MAQECVSGQVTCELIVALLNGMGVVISKRQVVRLLTARLETFRAEDAAVLEAGLHGAYVTVDDTGVRHAGKSGYTTQIGADTFTVFRTGPSKSRLAFLSRLCGSTASYVINDAALGYMRTAASYPDHPDQGRAGPEVWILSGPRPGYGPERPSPVCPPAEGDAMFPPIDPAQWHEVARQEYAAGPDGEAPFTTLTYERRCE